VREHVVGVLAPTAQLTDAWGGSVGLLHAVKCTVHLSLLAGQPFGAYALFGISSLGRRHSACDDGRHAERHKRTLTVPSYPERDNATTKGGATAGG